MARAKYFLLLSEPFTGEEAASMGIVSLAVDASQLDAKSVEIAIRLAEQAPAATRWTKSMLNHWLRQAAPIFDASLAFEFIGFAGPEGREGIDAFLQKRTPKFPEDAPT
jgi:enoyl-CoA hydratase